MFERIIVATDLSPASFAIVNCLGGLRTLGAEQCLLLQCLSFHEAASMAYSYQTEPAESRLNEQKQILEQQGYSVEARTVVGAAKREVSRIAVEEDYSLIVVGTQGESLIVGKLLGGVAYGIINSAETPVLVMPVEKKPGADDACEPVARCSFGDHIMFATDFSEMADSAFDSVKRLVAEGVKKVTLVHVQDKTKLEHHPKERLEEFNNLDRDRLENLKQTLLKMGNPTVDTEVCFGVPFQEITRLAQERNAQVIVMGTQGRGFAGEIFLGSVSHSVARSAVAPVLLIPVAR